MLGFIARYWYVFSAVALLSITGLSLMPLPELPEVPGNDKTHHFIAYSLLMFPVAIKQPKYWLFIAGFFVGWSGVIELLQPFVNRFAEWLDLLANCGGILLGTVLGKICQWFTTTNSVNVV